jgi:tetratricopeptide (TPR) repeat protein
LRLLQDAVQRAEAMKFGANHALRLTWLGEAYLLAGDEDAAKRHALRAVELARQHGERGHEAYALRLLGDLTIRRSGANVETAAEHYRAALALAQTLGMQPLAAALASSLP